MKKKINFKKKKNINNNNYQNNDNNPNDDDESNLFAQNINKDPNNFNEQKNLSSSQNKKENKNINPRQSIGNEDNQIIDEIFQDIKQKLEDDYKVSNVGWNDNQLKNKVKHLLSNDIRTKLKSDKEDGIAYICELIGEELLEV